MTAAEPEFLAVLQSELRSRGVAAADEVIPWPRFAWAIRTDEFGLTLRFAREQFVRIDEYLAKAFGSAVFSSRHGPTVIYRNDIACVTIMLTTGSSGGELILLDWRSPTIRSQMAERLLAAIGHVADRSVQDAAAAVADAIDSIASDIEDTKWKQAVAALDDARDTLNAFRADLQAARPYR